MRTAVAINLKLRASYQITSNLPRAFVFPIIIANPTLAFEALTKSPIRRTASRARLFRDLGGETRTHAS